MWPFIIAGFTILLVVLLLLVGTHWRSPPSGLPWSRDDASQTGLQLSTPTRERTTWWERNFGIQRAIGVLLVVGGLWHIATPWINQYSNVTTLTRSSIASGVTLAVVGLAFVIFRGGAGLAWVAGAVGVWVLVAPQVLGFGGPGLASNEAIWGGVITIVLAILAGFERRFGQESRTDQNLNVEPSA